MKRKYRRVALTQVVLVSGILAPMLKPADASASKILGCEVHVTNLAKTAKCIGNQIEAKAKEIAHLKDKVADLMKKLGDLPKMAKDFVCTNMMPGICPIIDFFWTTGKEIVDKIKAGKGIGGALKEVGEGIWKDLKDAVDKKFAIIKAKLGDIFASYKNQLKDDPPQFNKLWDFAKVVVTKSGEICQEMSPPGPKFIGEAVCWVTGVVISSNVTPPVASMVVANWAVRKISKPLIELLVKGFSAMGGGGSIDSAVNENVTKPLKNFLAKVVAGAKTAFTKLAPAAIGKAIGRALDAATSGLADALGKFAREALKSVGAVAGGAISLLVKNPETKKRIQTALLKVADIAEKLESVTKKALGVGGKAEAAALSPDDIAKVIETMSETLRDQILVVLDKPLRNLVGKLVSLLTKLLDTPRNTMVAAIGSIPYAGGALSSGLNFGLGALAEMMSDFLLEQLQEIVGKTIGEAVGDVGTDLKKTLSTPNGAKAAAGFLEFLKFVGEAARSTAEASLGGVDGVLVRRLFREFVDKLRVSPEKAKTELKKLVDKLKNLLSGEMKPIAASIAEGLGPVAGGVVDEVEGCGRMITGLNAESAKGVFTCLKNTLQAALSTAAVSMARALYDDFIKFLRTNWREAKTKLQKLSEKLAVVVKGVKEYSDPVVELINEGASKLVDRVAFCREMITALTVDSAKAVFGCVKEQLKDAASSVARAAVDAATKLYDEFVNLVKTNVGAAKEKIGGLVKTLAAAVPDAQSIAGPVIASLGPEAAAVAEDLLACRSAITGLNRESVVGVFGCLKAVLKSAATAAVAAAVAIPRKLYDDFVSMLSSNWSLAKAKLQELTNNLATVVADATKFAPPVIALINAGTPKLAGKLGMCKQMITGLNRESAEGVFGCLRLVLESAK